MITILRELRILDVDNFYQLFHFISMVTLLLPRQLIGTMPFSEVLLEFNVEMNLENQLPFAETSRRLASSWSYDERSLLSIKAPCLAQNLRLSNTQLEYETLKKILSLLLDWNWNDI